MIEEVKGSISELKEKIDAMQNREANVFNPSGENSDIPKLPIAQEGVGASVEPQDSII